MALDDTCLACGSGQGAGSDPDRETFLRNYRSLGKDERTACLMVTGAEVALSAVECALL